jgi:hypothetical protein
MGIFTNSIPVWVSVLFLVSFIIPIFMISNVAKQGAIAANFDSMRIQKISNGILIFFAVYYLYVMLMSFTEVFHANTLPPKVLLFTAIPLLVFYFFYIFRTKTYWQILENVSLSSLVRLHIFRLVGIFFIIAWYYDALPKYFAFSAGFGDIFAAVTAVIVANFIDKKAAHYKKITLIWNIIGFWDIVSVIISAIYVTKQAIASGEQGILEMTNFPYCLIPAFAPATIIFLHISIFKKLKMVDKVN